MLKGVVADPGAGKSDANEAGDGAASIFEKVNSRRAQTIECSQLECERSAADLIAKRPLSRREEHGAEAAGDTTHLSVSDHNGCVVMLTQSIQSMFGAKIAHPALGFIYNNYLSTCRRKPHLSGLMPRCRLDRMPHQHSCYVVTNLFRSWRSDLRAVGGSFHRSFRSSAQ